MKEKEICVDDPNFRFEGDPGRDCHYIAARSYLCARLDDKGQKIGLLACPFTCHTRHLCKAFLDSQMGAETPKKSDATMESSDFKKNVESDDEASTVQNIKVVRI